MASLEEILQEWIVTETNFLAEKSLKSIPDVSTLSLLTEGKNKKIWEYMLTHVRSKCTVQKVKRILKLKRDQNNPEKLFPKPINDLSKLHQKITNAEDKQTFLKNSISNMKKKIMCMEEDFSELHQEIDRINQKTSILYLIALHYQEKTALLNSLHSRLTLHFTDGVYKQNVKSLSLNIEASAKKSHSITPLEINPKIKQLLEQSESLAIKKFRNSPGITSLVFNLQKTVTEVFKGVFMCNLIFTLKEQSKISCMNMVQRLSQDQSVFLKSSKLSRRNKRDSEKLLKEMRLDHISINFSIKKIKNDICRLLSDKNSLLITKINPFSEHSEYQTKLLLLDKIAENMGLRECVSYLEEILHDKQTQANILKQSNAVEVMLNEDTMAMKSKFYNDFDLICSLLHLAPSMLDYITQRIAGINKYSSEDLNLTMSSVLQEFPYELENELKFENEALWNVLKKNDVIKPMLLGKQMPNQSIPEGFWNLIDIAPFQNLVDVCRNAKMFKDYISTNVNDGWEYDEKKLPNACKMYDEMMNMLEEMENALHVCQENLENAVSFRSTVQTVLQDWWEQSAQFIPDIVYDNKTLKMWIDIVNAADGIV